MLRRPPHDRLPRSGHGPPVPQPLPGQEQELRPRGQLRRRRSHRHGPRRPAQPDLLPQPAAPVVQGLHEVHLQHRRRNSQKAPIFSGSGRGDRRKRLQLRVVREQVCQRGGETDPGRCSDHHRRHQGCARHGREQSHRPGQLPHRLLPELPHRDGLAGAVGLRLRGLPQGPQPLRRQAQRAAPASRRRPPGVVPRRGHRLRRLLQLLPQPPQGRPGARLRRGQHAHGLLRRRRQVQLRREADVRRGGDRGVRGPVGVRELGRHPHDPGGVQGHVQAHLPREVPAAADTQLPGEQWTDMMKLSDTSRLKPRRDILSLGRVLP